MERLIIVPGRNAPPDVPDVLECTINPAEIELTHDAGLTRRPLSIAPVGDGPGRALAHGGAALTTLHLGMLFEGRRRPGPDGQREMLEDVRQQTRWLYRLAAPAAPGLVAPCEVDLIWGKSWAFRGILRTVSERPDIFSREGLAQRSWVRLELVGRQLDTFETFAAVDPASGYADGLAS